MVRFEELSKPLQKEGFAGAIHKVQEEKDLKKVLKKELKNKK